MPPELSMALDAQAFHILPEPGGLRDQPTKLMRTLRACLNVYTAINAYRIGGAAAGHMAEWKSAHPDLWEIVRDVRELRERHGQQ